MGQEPRIVQEPGCGLEQEPRRGQLDMDMDMAWYRDEVTGKVQEPGRHEDVRVWEWEGTSTEVWDVAGSWDGTGAWEGQGPGRV